ncbi:hypothetical protein ES704_02726 [subsurface metagenome]|jgi:hypothetical protein
MKAAIPLLLGLSAATFMLVTLPTFLRNILPRLGSRVQYRDGLYYVAVRNPGEWHEIREFIQPGNPHLIAFYSQIGSDVWSCLDFVCRNISYRRDIGEFWQLPSETIATGQGDCEDSAILLTSLLKNFTNAYVVLGSLQGWGHAWGASKEGEILETTYARAMIVPDPENYHPYVYFSDQEVIEMWPGALKEVFELRRNEARKINLMAAALT